MHNLMLIASLVVALTTPAASESFSRGDTVRIDKPDRGGLMACKTSEDLYALIDMANQEDGVAWRQMLIAGRCEKLPVDVRREDARLR
jgi:hypothetical protein